MPEGDTIFRTATVLRRALAGRVVTGLELVAPKASAAAKRRRIEGGVVRKVESNGKHLLITFGTDGEDIVLHTHMKMSGEWHVYRTGERWRRPPSDARVVIRTAEYIAPCFRPPIVELLAAHEVGLHPILSTLGPDVIADDFDEAEALRRLRLEGDRDVATALLAQRTLSGVGNVFKCEALFLTRVSPYARVADLDNDTLGWIVSECRRLLRRNRGGGARRTRFALNARERVWVYDRHGQPCRECGTTIRHGPHPGEVRKSWYCPQCQGVAEARHLPLPVRPGRGRG